jgi:acyl-CoA thioesterase-1
MERVTNIISRSNRHYGDVVTRGFVWWHRRLALVWSVGALIAALMMALMGTTLAPSVARADAASGPVIMVLGDSLVAGHGLAQGKAFPDVLGRQLAAAGLPAQMINAGVSGDTTAGGLARLDWSLASQPDAAIIVLGGNDLLRGLAPESSFANLDAIITRLQSRGMAILLAGMQAPRNFGADYAAEFDAIYQRLAAKHDILFYPFFLEGVALRPDMNLPDGIHPNDAGIRHIATKMLPLAKILVTRAAAR